MLPLEHKVEQTLSEIGCVRSTLSEQSRKLEETDSLVKQVAGQHEVQENIALQTSEKLEFLKGSLGKGNVEKTDAEIQTDIELQRRWQAERSFQSVNLVKFPSILYYNNSVSPNQYPLHSCRKKWRDENLNRCLVKYML